MSRRRARAAGAGFGVSVDMCIEFAHDATDAEVRKAIRHATRNAAVKVREARQAAR